MLRRTDGGKMAASAAMVDWAAVESIVIAGRHSLERTSTAGAREPCLRRHSPTVEGLHRGLSSDGRAPAGVARRGTPVQAPVQHHPRTGQVAGSDQRDDKGVLYDLALRMAAADADDLVEHRLKMLHTGDIAL